MSGENSKKVLREEFAKSKAALDTVFDSFKSSSRKGGTFTVGEVRTGRAVASGTFTFNPHWRPTVVSAPVDVRRRAEPLELELVVNNSRGRSVSRAFNCTW